MTFGLGYLMGIIVGEGSFTEGPRLKVALQEADPTPVRQLQERFGGSINGPYRTTHRNGRQTAMWQWNLGGQALFRALGIFDQYLPASKKREQYESWKVKHAGWLAFQVRQLPAPPYRGQGATRFPSREVQESRHAARAARVGRAGRRKA